VVHATGNVHLQLDVAAASALRTVRTTAEHVVLSAKLELSVAGDLAWIRSRDFTLAAAAASIVRQSAIPVTAATATVSNVLERFATKPVVARTRSVTQEHASIVQLVKPTATMFALTCKQIQTTVVHVATQHARVFTDKAISASMDNALSAMARLEHNVVR